MELVPDLPPLVTWTDEQVKQIFTWYDELYKPRKDAWVPPAEGEIVFNDPQVFMQDHFLCIKMITSFLDTGNWSEIEKTCLNNLLGFLLEGFFEQDDEYLPPEFVKLHPTPKEEWDIDED